MGGRLTPLDLFLYVIAFVAAVAVAPFVAIIVMAGVVLLIAGAMALITWALGS
jgi:hypothetical protein